MMRPSSTKIRLIPAMFIVIILAFCCQTALAANGGPWLETDKRVYQGDDIRVHFYNAPGYSSDWICIVPEGAPDTEAGDYKYMPAGAQQGVLHFRSPRPGRYEARAFYNYRSGGYVVSARSRFAVVPPGYHHGHRSHCADRCLEDYHATLVGCREESRSRYYQRCERQAKEQERQCLEKCRYR